MRTFLAVLASAAIVACGRNVQAVCCPFYCNGCFLQTTAQWNVVMMDRGAGVVRLIPNVAFAGPALFFFSEDSPDGYALSCDARADFWR